MEALSIAHQAASALRILQENSHGLQEANEMTKNSLFRITESLSSSLAAVASLERSLAGANEKYLYMQELRDYVSVLCEFLQDKGPLIEELQEAMQRLHEEHANALLERRAADNANELTAVEAAVNAAKLAFARGAGTATTTAAAASAVKDGTSTIPKLDEFGCDENLQKCLETKQQAQAHDRRLKRAAERRMASTQAPNREAASAGRIEGESSSEGSEREERAYKSGRQEILQTAERVFGDASEEYSQLGKVKQRLEAWKQVHGVAYQDAYMSLIAPAVFAPYVRLELLHWDPLYGNAGLDNMQWFMLLFDYGMQVNGKKVEEGDADINLIPELVEKVALPVLHHEIAHCWDTLSTERSKHAIAAFQEMLIYVDVSRESLHELLAAARACMAEAVLAVELPSWSLQVTTAVPRAGQLTAQQFGTSVHLLQNLGLWKDILAMPVLEHLALDQLLSAKILVHLQVLLPTVHDAIICTERVLSAVSGVWVGGRSAELSPKLAPFIENLMSLTTVIEKRHDGGTSSEDTMGLVNHLLVDVNEYDWAQHLSKIFQLKEAL